MWITRWMKEWLISAMSDLGSRSRDRALMDRFVSFSCCGLSEPLSSDKTYFKNQPENPPQMEAYFHALYSATFAKCLHLIWPGSCLMLLISPLISAPGTVANIPEFTSMQFHENQRKQTMGRRGSSTEKPVCLLWSFVALCLYGFIKTVHACIWHVQV